MIRISVLFLSLCFVVNVAYTQDDLLRNSGNTTQSKKLIEDTVPKKISLSEIVVKGKKPPVAFKVDKQVFRASEYDNAKNGNAIDIIKNLPSVSVNGQGEINLRGSSSFLVLLNGKPTQGDPAFVLSQLPASSIEHIEVISSPGAAYDADGKSGILNIITKTAPEKGLLVQASMMTGTPPLNDFDNVRYNKPQRRGADVSLSYQQGKWDLSSGINFLRNDIAGYREGYVYTKSNDVLTTFPSQGDRSFKRYNYGGRVSASFTANEKNKFEAGFYLGKRFNSRIADLLYTNERTNLLTQQTSSFTYFNENTQNKEGVFSLLSLGSQHQLSKATSLGISLQYEGAKLESLTTNDNISYTGLYSIFEQTINPTTNPLHAYRMKMDLSSKKNNILWQVGYQFRNDIQRGDFSYLTRTAGSNAFVINPAYSSTLSVRNNIHGVYAQQSMTSGRWFYQGGLRLEHMLRNLDFAQANNNKKLPLLNLFPSYLLKYELDKHSTIKNSFTRRIKRTNNYELNPFPEREHSETLEQGDPELLPEITGIWELGFERRFNKGSFYTTLYHQRVKNPIQRVNNIYNDTIISRVYTNAGIAKQFGVETNITFRPVKYWQLIVGGNIYRYSIVGEIFDGTIRVDNRRWVYSINATQSFSLPKNWTAQLSVNYLSLRATAQGEDGEFLTPSLSVKKTTKDNRWTFQAQWLYIDAGLGISNRQRISTRGQYFYTTTNYIYEPDQIQFSVSFNLMKKNRKINLPQSEMAEKEF